MFYPTLFFTKICLSMRDCLVAAKNLTIFCGYFEKHVAKCHNTDRMQKHEFDYSDCNFHIPIVFMISDNVEMHLIGCKPQTPACLLQ